LLEGSSLAAPLWLLSPKANAYLRLLRMVADNGTLGGFPVYSSAGINGVTLLASDRVALSLGDAVSIGVSDHGDVEMADDPTHDSVTPTETTLVSLWQTDSRAIRATAFANWSLVAPADSNGSHGVATLTGATWD
jgi:hypothetical protein